MYAKLWMPEGPRQPQRQPFARRESVGQEGSMRSMSKSSSEIDEESACADGESSRSNFAPPRKSKRVTLDKGEDPRKWASLHKQPADVTVRNPLLALTPSQGGERGASNIDVDARGPGGMSALHLASCRCGYSDGSSHDDDKDRDHNGGAMVSDLLSLGASCQSKTDQGETPLHLAARHSRADVVKCLLDNAADANSRDQHNRTPLHLAIGADAQGAFQILLRNRDTDLEARMNDGTTPLILAARHDLPDFVRCLIKAGVKVNSVDNCGKTALHWAASVNSLEVAKELLRNGAKKDVQDKMGQTPLFLGCREGSIQTVRHLLLNYANRKAADTMDITPEDIAKQNHHHEIVELLMDWSLGCNSLEAISAATSPPGGQKSPLTSMDCPPATSPLPVEIHNGGAPLFLADFQPARPKTTVNRAPGTRPKSTALGSNNNNNAKRKRKKARPDEEVCSVLTIVTTPSPPNMAISCATGQPHAFSPNFVSITNGLSPLGSTGISPVDSTTLPPLHAPNSLDTQQLSSLEPLNILSLDDLAILEEVKIGWDDLLLDDIDLFNDPAGMSKCRSPPSTTMEPLTVLDHIVLTTSDCMYVPNAAPPVKRALDSLQGKILYPVHSTPPRKDYQNGYYLKLYHQPLHQPFYAGGERLPLQPQASSFVNGCESSPQAFVSSFPTPFSDSLEQWSSPSSSSSC